MRDCGLKALFFLSVCSAIYYCPTPIVGAHELYSEPCSSESGGNKVHIVSIAPDPSETLTVGQVVDLEVEVEYEVVEPNAVVTLVVQKGEISGSQSSSVIASKTKILRSKSGRFKMQQSFVVPKTGAVMVITPLMGSSSGQTSVVDTRAYPVVYEDGSEVVIDTIAKMDSHSPFTEAPPSENFKITSYSPDTSQPLYVGEAVAARYELQYEVDKVPAQLVFTVQKMEITENPRDLLVASQRKVVHGKKGSIRIEEDFVVPATDALMFTAYITTDMHSTPDMDAILYKQYSVERGSRE